MDIQAIINDALIAAFEENNIPFNGTWVFQQSIALAKDFEDGTAQDPDYE